MAGRARALQYIYTQIVINTFHTADLDGFAVKQRFAARNRRPGALLTGSGTIGRVIPSGIQRHDIGVESYLGAIVSG